MFHGCSQYYPESSLPQGWIVASETISSTTFTVRNLRPDTSYMFLVRARNDHGISLPSTVSDLVATKGGDGSRNRENYGINVPEVRAALQGNIVQLKKPDVMSSTTIKLTWKVRNETDVIFCQ